MFSEQIQFFEGMPGFWQLVLTIRQTFLHQELAKNFYLATLNKCVSLYDAVT